jgi:hypothetical protein
MTVASFPCWPIAKANLFDCTWCTQAGASCRSKFALSLISWQALLQNSSETDSQSESPVSRSGTSVTGSIEAVAKARSILAWIGVDAGSTVGVFRRARHRTVGRRDCRSPPLFKSSILPHDVEFCQELIQFSETLLPTYINNSTDFS